MEITVYVHTRGRTGIEPITLNELQKFSTVKPVVVCPPNEVAFWQRKVANVIEFEPLGLSKKRQFIIENAPTRGVVLLDDDIYFSQRLTPGDTTLTRVTNLDPLFAQIAQNLEDGYAHGAVSARQGNQHIDFDNADCIRAMTALYFDRDVFLHEGIRFDTVQIMQDFYTTLSLLTRGYPNRVIYNFCWSQRGSGAKGGVSLYRTKEMLEETAQFLAGEFPDFVTVVEKVSSSQKGEMVQRTDVNVQWLKAWKSRDLNRQLMPGYVPAVPNLSRR